MSQWSYNENTTAHDKHNNKSIYIAMWQRKTINFRVTWKNVNKAYTTKYSLIRYIFQRVTEKLKLIPRRMQFPMFFKF